MTDPPAGAPPRQSVLIRRFPDWRTLRAHLAGDARQAGASLLVLAPTDGAAAALADAIRRQLLAGRSPAVPLPEVLTPAAAIRELLLRSDPPGRLATPLARSLMMENALLEAAGTAGAPRGNPLRLSGPLLRLLDEQARDRAVDPDRPAVRALIERAGRRFAEAAELDDGAGRLLRLTSWLERVHAGYLAQLSASGALDLDLARRRLRAAPTQPGWSGVRVVGDQTGGLADHELFGSLVPPEDFHFLLLEGDPTPTLPKGWSALEEAAAPGVNSRPRLFVPAPSGAPGGERFLFRRTDRAGEAGAAVTLLLRYREETKLWFPGFDRCAVAARNPAAYLPLLAARLEEARIPFQTRLQPSLAEEPATAALDDVLAFAERPGRLANGLRLLRSPGFHDDRLPGPPGRLADVAEFRLAEADIPNTHDPAELEGLAAAVRKRGEELRARVRRKPEDPEARREDHTGRELGLAAAGLTRFAHYAQALAPIRDGATPFRVAVQCFAEFVAPHFRKAPDDVALEALRQAADPALPHTPVGNAARFRDRVRRQLRRHPTNRYPSRKGVHLIAAEDAPFGDYECLILLGVGDADWPGPRPGNIFFPTRVLERATRLRFADARAREARLLAGFPGLAGQAAGFTRAELEDGFPAGESPLFASLEARLGDDRAERIEVGIPDVEAGGPAAPLPESLERQAPEAVNLAERPLSPSALVLYSRNPAQFFVERVLRLRREETLSDTGSRTARGSRLHRLLAEAVPAFVGESGPICEENLDAALAFFRGRYRALEDPGLTPEVREAEELWLFGGDSHPAALEWFLREEADRGPSQLLQVEELLEGTVEPAADALPPLRVRGFADRVDRAPDGGRRVVEYKSGSAAGQQDAFLQVRLYARLADGDEPAQVAVPFFRDRVWGVPDKPEELDRRICAARDGLAAGAFPVPADPKDIKSFHWPLAIRPDLPEVPPRAPPLKAPPAPVPAATRGPSPGFRPSDHAARRSAADPSRNVVLRASAGTGKTTVLTERYLNLVRAGVPPRNILALTFTRKAAAEMKGRIVARLRDPEFTEARARRPELAEVAVSTLDAFNLGLIREFPLDAGVAPGVEVLDEREMPVVRREAAERVLSGATGFDRRVLAELPLLGKSLSRLDQIAEAYLENRLTWRGTFEERAERLAREPVGPFPLLRSRLLPEEDRVARFLAGYRGRVPLPVRLGLRLEPQEGSRDALDRESLVGWFRPDLKTYPKGAKAALELVQDEYRRLKQLLKEFDRDWRDALNERTFAPLWALLAAVEAEYQELKHERGVMDFDDLTLAATRMLRNASEFAESRFRLEARYHHLLLDEFQDTSDPQWELLRAIADPWTSGEGLAAEEVRRVTGGRLATPTIFVVGDHKQSIYRFRNARVEIIESAERWMRKMFPSRPEPRAVLSWNFRSSAPLRAFVNDAAAAVAAADATSADWQFRYDENDRLPEDPDPADGAPEEAIPIAVAVAQDHGEASRRVARRIADLTANGVRPNAIAVLARRNNELGTYCEAVERLGIPTYLVRGTGFFETSEIRDLTALCRFLARPDSDLRAVELLRSRFFAVPGSTLAALRAADREAETPFSELLRTGGRTPAGLDGQDRGRLAEAGAQVTRWIGFSRQSPPSLAVHRILVETGYLARASAGRADGPFAGRQQAANVERALEHLRRLERRGFASFAAAARHFETAAGGGHDGTQAPLQAVGAVQVLTIHAAKGLEFEHVFLVDLNAANRPPGGKLRVQEGDDGSWSVALVKESSDWEVRDGGRSSAEERRCLYVAMTRAKRGLTLSGATRFNARGEPYKAQGLAVYLPAELWNAAARTAREPQSEIRWRRHRLAVLPPSGSR